MAKGQNPIACSGVIRYAAGCPGEGKNLLISLDDIGDNHNNSENVSWVFDTDYAPLADDSIAKVIFIGKRCHDYYLRALMAGVSEDRLFCPGDLAAGRGCDRSERVQGRVPAL